MRSNDPEPKMMAVWLRAREELRANADAWVSKHKMCEIMTCRNLHFSAATASLTKWQHAEFAFHFEVDPGLDVSWIANMLSPQACMLMCPAQPPSS